MHTEFVPAALLDRSGQVRRQRQTHRRNEERRRDLGLGVAAHVAHVLALRGHAWGEVVLRRSVRAVIVGVIGKG